MAGRGVKVTFAIDASNYSAAAGKIVSINRNIAKSAEEAGHATVSSMQASSASLRLLEGGMNNNLRAAERFLSTIPGVGAAMQAAFPVVGLIAVAGLFVRAGEKAYEFVQHLRSIPNAINQGVGSIAATMQQTNDELQVSIDKIANANAKMEHRPENGLKLALDEASVAADKLADKLAKDNAQLTELLKKNSIGGFSAFVFGGRSTTDSDKQQTAYSNKVLGIQTSADDKRYGANGDAKKLADINAQEQKDLRDAAVAEVKAAQGILDANQRRDSQNVMAVGSHDAEDASARARLSVAKRQVVGIDLTSNLDSAQSQNDSDTAAKDAREQAAAAARRMAEAQRKAQEAQLQQMNEAHERFQEAATRSGEDELNFWSVQVAMLSKGSLAYREAFKNVARERAQALKETAEGTQRFADETGKVTSPDQYDLSRSSDTESYLKGSGSDTVAHLKSMNESINLTRQLSTAIADQALDQQVATGALTAHDAAIQKAVIHQQQYLDLVAQMKNQGASDNDLQKASNDRTLQINADASSVLNTSFTGKFKDTLNSMANDFTDFADSISGIFRNSLSSVNQELGSMLTSKYHNGFETRQAFDQIGRSTAGSVVNMGLQGAEGSVMKALGLSSGGKLGTQSNPMYVKMADAVSGATGALSGVLGKAGGLLSGLFGGASSPAIKAGAGIGLDSLASDFSNLPMLATGGPLSSNQMAVVGENGPELFMSHSSGTVVPNSQAFGGGDTHHHYQIDARHSTDPAAVHKAVTQALIKAHGPTIKGAVQATHEFARRRPSAAR